ncbi:CCR4-NOT transcription complex subunit 3 [Hordeum vulgare]|nr:CCR4-NOT transcription complex subunit 3 [Hordeum vulgare]
MMITEFTSNHKMDAIDIGKHLSRLYDRVDQLQGQIYDLQNQNCEYEYRFKSIRFTEILPFLEQVSASYEQALMDARKQIEREMECFKDHREKAKAETRDWLNSV